MKIVSCNSLKPTEAAAILAGLWNRACRELHGFFPLAAADFEQAVLRNPRFRGENLLLAEAEGAVVGFAHCDWLSGFNFPAAGVVEALVVEPGFRRRGVGKRLLEAGTALLKKQGARVIDFAGSWPYTPFYSALIDGSERSGIFGGNAAALALCAGCGFRPEERSLVMRLNPARVTEFALPEGCRLERGERVKRDSWLDFAFRRWRLFDHVLLNGKGEVLSRAIHARMDGVSDFLGRELRAVFSVSTPERFRRQGWALLNLGLLLNRLANEGADEAELHVYADNAPAVNLYRSLGFGESARTVAMRRRF